MLEKDACPFCPSFELSLNALGACCRCSMKCVHYGCSMKCVCSMGAVCGGEHINGLLMVH